MDTAAATARLAHLAAAQDGVVTRRQALAAGVPLHVLRQHREVGAWPSPVAGTLLVEAARRGLRLERAQARAATLVAPGAVVGLASAARLHGLEGAPDPGAVQLLSRGHLRERPGVEPHRASLEPRDVVDLRGIRVTGVVRTLADLVPALGRPEGLAVLDSALRTGRADRADLLRARDLAAGRRGAAGVHDLWTTADGRAESPLESRARLCCLDEGLVPDHLQLVVRDGAGRFVARADMAFERPRRGGPPLLPLLLEADGVGPHSEPPALLHDRRRANALAALGFVVVRCTWADTCTPGVVPAMVRAAL